METFLRRILLFFTSRHCYDEYFTNYNFFDGECLKTSLSKTMGTVIILGSVTVKVPQIMKIMKSKNAEGINLLGVLLDLFAITSNFAYAYVRRFPFSSWGEVLFLAIQTAVIAFLILRYTRGRPEAFIFTAGYLLLVYVLAFESLPLRLLWLLQILNLPIVIVGKGIQAWSNFQSKSTGQLSFITCWMQFIGTTVRIFTSIQETGDATFILSYLICSILNGTIAFQFLVYGGVVDEKKKAK